MKRFYSLFAFALSIGSISAVWAQDDNEDPVFEPDPAPKVRLAFTGHNNAYRQVLLGFQGNVCTDGIDPGYDAINVFDLPNDMYFWVASTELFIQGVAEFGTDNVYPLGVKSSTASDIHIALVNTENFDASQPIYIYDNVTHQYHDLKSGSMTASVQAGTFNDRFSLRFSQTALGIGTVISEDVEISYYSNDKMLSIATGNTGTALSGVQLTSMTGQQAGAWTCGNTAQASISLQGMAAGIYIATVTTSKGTVSKKLAIR